MITAIDAMRGALDQPTQKWQTIPNTEIQADAIQALKILFALANKVVVGFLII